MGDKFRRWKEGDQFSPSAAQLNGWTSASRQAAKGEAGPGGLLKDQSPTSFLAVDAKNDAGADLDASFPIVRLKTPIVTIEDNDKTPFNGVAFKVDKPNASTGANFAVLQGAVAENVVRPAVLVGLTWCKVDVANEADEFAIAVDGDADKLASGASGQRIVWKESGTGEKWAVVQLGGGGAGETEIVGRLIADVPANDWVEGAFRVERRSGNGWTYDEAYFDEEDQPLPIAVINAGLYTALRGSTGVTVRMRGRLTTVTVDDETKPAVEIIPHDTASRPGHVTSPANNLPQSEYHADGSNAYQLDGTPGCEEPP